MNKAEQNRQKGTQNGAFLFISLFLLNAGKTYTEERAPVFFFCVCPLCPSSILPPTHSSPGVHKHKQDTPLHCPQDSTRRNAHVFSFTHMFVIQRIGPNLGRTAPALDWKSVQQVMQTPGQPNSTPRLLRGMPRTMYYCHRKKYLSDFVPVATVPSFFTLAQDQIDILPLN